LIRGDAHDHRVDIYALGVLFYTILAGHVPYRGRHIADVLHQHLNDPIPRLTEECLDVPLAFEALVCSMMAKDPNDRPPSAAEVAAELLPFADSQQRLVEAFSGIPVQKVVGRDKEIAAIEQFMSAAMAETKKGHDSIPTALLLSGPAGTGKTPLLSEIQRRAMAKNIRFFHARCFRDQNNPYDGLGTILREQLLFLRTLGPEGMELLDTYEPVLLGSDPVDTKEARTSYFASWSCFYQDLSRMAPFVIWLDDIDMADFSSMELLRYLLRNSIGYPIAFLFTAEAGKSISDMLRTNPDINILSLPLGGLDPEGVAELVSLSLGISRIPADVVERIHSIFGGSPFLIWEFLLQFDVLPLERKLDQLRAELDDLASSGEQSERVSNIFNQRMRQCKPEELLTLRLISCFTSPVNTGILQRLVPFHQIHLKQILEHLVSKDLLLRTPDNLRHGIAHSLFQQFIYNGLPEKQSIHRAIAAVLDDLQNDPTGDESEQCAYHYEQCGDVDRASHHYLQAAEKKRAQFALRDCIALLEHARALPGKDSEDIHTLLMLAELYSSVGEHQRSAELYEKAIHIEPHAGLSMFSMLKSLAMEQIRGGQTETALETLRQASTHAANEAEQLSISEAMLHADIVRGNYDDALRRAQQILDTSLPQSRRPEFAGIFNALGIAYYHTDQHAESINAFQAVIDIFEPLHDDAKLIHPNLNIGNVYSSQGAFEQAERYWAQALAFSQHVGNLQQEALAYNNMGIAAYNQARYADAKRFYDQSSNIFYRIGDMRGLALCLTNLGEVHRVHAEYEQAISCWKKNLEYFRMLKDTYGITETILLLGEAVYTIGDFDMLSRLVEELSQLMRHGGSKHHRAEYLHLLGCQAKARGDIELAMTRLSDARVLYHDVNDLRNHALTSLLLADILIQTQQFSEASTVLQNVLASGATGRWPPINAEVLFQLGIVSRSNPALELEPPLIYFKQAYTLIQNEPVNEISWEVCLELGKEYLRRGLSLKGQQCILMAGQGIRMLANAFSEPELRDRYLSAHGRKARLAEIDSMLRPI
jgi:tetratricopeptide (TPR) repeat protein